MGRHRFQHPDHLVWLLGGLLGTATNLLITLLLMQWAQPSVAFFAGTLANEMVHHAYYHVLYVNQEITPRITIAKSLPAYVLIAGCATAILLGFSLVLPLWAAIGASLMVLAATNSAINRLRNFGSASLANVEYAHVDESFYRDQTDSSKVNAIRAMFHRQRFKNLENFVQQHFAPGLEIVDIGCGNCMWNTQGYPVIGVDINEQMLLWAQRNGRIQSYRLTDDLAKTGLPDSEADIVIASEVLEHMVNVEDVVKEVRRLLREGGVFLITVPYDIFLGPFFVLFNLNCLWQGYVRGSKYHRYRCGHVNHFTKARLRALLEKSGFVVKSLSVVNGLHLHAAACRVGRPSG